MNDIENKKTIVDEENGSSHYKAFQITEKGFELRQKAIANGENVIIEFTRGAIGSGRPNKDEDMYYRTELVTHVLDVPIKESYAKHVNHVMTIVIDNAELKEDLLMTEMGIFAKLIDRKTNETIIEETLYGYTYTDKYDYIPSATNYFIYREISFNTVLSRDGKFEIVFDKDKVYVTRRELDDILREFEREFTIILDKNLQEVLDNTEWLKNRHEEVLTEERVANLELIPTINTNAANLNTRLTQTRATNLDTIPTINTNVNTLLGRVPAAGSGIRSVQRGRFVPPTANNSPLIHNITIGAVNRTRAFVVFSTTSNSRGGGTDLAITRSTSAHLSANNILQFEIGSDRTFPSGITVEWQVIEFN